MELLKEDGEKSISKSIEDFADSEYTLNASRYLDAVEIENGVELGSVVSEERPARHPRALTTLVFDPHKPP